MQCLIFFATALLVAGAGPDRSTPGAAEAEAKMLRATVERQKKEILRLEQQVAELKQVVRARADTKAELSRARRVIFLVDASGSMVNVFDRATDEVHKGIDGLDAGVAFNVVWCSDSILGQAFLEPTLATPANKTRAHDALREAQTGGTTDFLAGLTAAFKVEPNVLWFISDGDQDGRQIREMLRAFNPSKKTTVNTVVALPEDAQPNDAAGSIRTLSRVAKDHGGVCIGLDGRELRFQEPTETRPEVGVSLPPAPPRPLPTGPSIFKEKPKIDTEPKGR